MNTLHSRRGMTLIEVLISSAIMAMTVVGFTMFLKSAGQAQRSIAGKADWGQLSQTLQLTFGRRLNCQKSGIVGMTLSPAAPGKDPVKVMLPSGAPFLEEGGTYFSRRITSVRFQSLTWSGTDGPGRYRYFATLRVTGSTIGAKEGTGNATRDFNLEVILDPDGRVVDCEANVSGP